ncbi:hypothetical protein [Actinomadura atramentaria]|uniref:hypothetical protein n=1 Tax=Actinomadura atramentaria TaxID=1990 RepID=UPI0003812383|nr:hypothetical protein [Actinomadura atramentaria]
MSLIYEGMLRHARELLAVRGPLDAELIVSDVLGSWWGRRVADGDVEEVVGEGLVRYAADAGTPAALALLTGVACLGTPGQAAAAEKAAARLRERGVARPPWADLVGTATPEGCYVSGDVYGDQESLVCVFSYGGADRHALVVSVDMAKSETDGRVPAYGMVRDAWVSSRVDRLLDQCRAEDRDHPLMRFGDIDPAAARARLDRALERTAEVPDPPVADTFAAKHALLRARLRALPAGGRPPRPDVPGADRRATLAARFLASDEAEGLSDLSAAGRCVDRIIDYGCVRDFGRPLRVSPLKAEMFLLDWLPRKVLLSPAEQEAVPHVLASWVRWAGRRTGLPDEGVRATLDAVWDATEAFAAAYRDPAASGLDRDLVNRLLPDGDLEALPRRAFALPFLTGRHQVAGREVDFGALDPSDPGDRRVMLEFDRPGASADELDARERLTVRLWAGDPPELWDAAQALLDAGVERHAVLNRLEAALERAGDDAARLRAALAALRRDPPRG